MDFITSPFVSGNTPERWRFNQFEFGIYVETTEAAVAFIQGAHGAALKGGLNKMRKHIDSVRLYI